MQVAMEKYDSQSVWWTMKPFHKEPTAMLILDHTAIFSDVDISKTFLNHLSEIKKNSNDICLLVGFATKGHH